LASREPPPYPAIKASQKDQTVLTTGLDAAGYRSF